MKTNLSQLRSDTDKIIHDSIQAVLPDEAVRRALEEFEWCRKRRMMVAEDACKDTSLQSEGRFILISAGKAAWQMAKAAVDILGEPDEGIVITKYGHVKGEITGVKLFAAGENHHATNVRCFEAGHPVPDENGFSATLEAIKAVKGLGVCDKVLFLISGGASALFESPAISGEELQSITQGLLKSGADINEINTVRKHLSKVKGGRFAKLIEPATVYSVILSDVLGDRPETIASGPTVADPGTCADAVGIIEKYGISISPEARNILETQETPKKIENSEIRITGSVRELVKAAERACAGLGYETEVITDCLECEAKDAGRMLAQKIRTAISAEKQGSDIGDGKIAHKVAGAPRKLAFIAGGETVVRITGTGLGGRNQELALAAADGIRDLKAVVFSVGSDGTDGPTDAAGGIVDGGTAEMLEKRGISIGRVLHDNDSYHALEQVNGLIFTGPTGTNVNDVAVALVEL